MLIIQNVISEVFYFMCMVLLIVVAFGQCATVLFSEEGKELTWFDSFSKACETLFIAMLGVLDESQVTEVREKYVGERGKLGELNNEKGGDYYYCNVAS